MEKPIEAATIVDLGGLVRNLEVTLRAVQVAHDGTVRRLKPIEATCGFDIAKGEWQETGRRRYNLRLILNSSPQQ